MSEPMNVAAVLSKVRERLYRSEVALFEGSMSTSQILELANQTYGWMRLLLDVPVVGHVEIDICPCCRRPVPTSSIVPVGDDEVDYDHCCSDCARVEFGLTQCESCEQWTSDDEAHWCDDESGCGGMTLCNACLAAYAAEEN